MANIEPQITPVQETQTELEILKWTGQIQANIKNEITSDAVLAHLNTEQKEYVEEMTVNAYFIQNIINMLQKRKYHTWENGNWTLKQANKTKIQEAAQKAFNSYMTKIQMVCILNRNTKNNWLVAQFAKAPPEPEPTNTEPQEPTIKLYNKLLNKKENEEKQ